MLSLKCEIYKIKQTSEYNKIERNRSHRCKEQISGYQWGEGMGEGQGGVED